MNFVELETICDEVAATLRSYDERSGRATLKNPTLEKVQRVNCDHFFVPSKSKRFSVASVKDEELSFSFTRLLLLFLLRNQRGKKISAKLAFVRYFELRPPVDNVDHPLNCLCLR